MKMPVFIVITATSFATIYSAQEIAETIILKEQKSRTEVNFNRLPSNSIQFISQQNENPQIKKVYELFDNKGMVKGYEVVLTTHTGNEVLKFNAEGKYLKK